jgi:hypothetical protein
MDSPRTGNWNVTICYILCAILIFVFAVWSYGGRAVDWSPDSEEYLAVTKNLTSEFAQDRPPGYPFLLRFSMLLGENWQEITVVFQCLMLSAIGVMFIYLIQNLFGLPWIGALFALLIGFEPSMAHWANGILPETFLSFFVTLIWFLSLHLLKLDDHLTRRKIVVAAFVGLLSGYAVLIKPIWIFGFVPLVLAIILINLKKLKNSFILASVMVIMHCAVILPWQIFLNNHFGQKFISRTGSINLNLVTLRAGLAKNCPGTPMYEYLQTKGLLNDAISLKWDDFNAFRKMKDAIPWETRDDPSFYRAAIKSEPQTYARLLVTRWPKFITSRPVPLQNEGFPHMPQLVRYLYGGAYAWFFKLLLPVLLIGALFLAIKSSELRPLILLSFGILIYVSILIVFTSYQDALITRMRVSVMPIMIFLSVLPVLSIIQACLRR